MRTAIQNQKGGRRLKYSKNGSLKYQIVTTMAFVPNRKFKKKYDRLFKNDPGAANLFLLLCELSTENGQVETNENELAELIQARFNDPEEYAL